MNNLNINTLGNCAYATSGDLVITNPANLGDINVLFNADSGVFINFNNTTANIFNFSAGGAFSAAVSVLPITNNVGTLGSALYRWNYLYTNNIDCTNDIVFSKFTSAGILHNNASGDISSSLIVAADITNSTITNAKLAAVASANTASHIVVRDSSGNFAAGTITASLTGNVSGNLTGNVTGNVTGDVSGNLTGNVTGNVSGTEIR
jgi:hypothetical protein